MQSSSSFCPVLHFGNFRRPFCTCHMMGSVTRCFLREEDQTDVDWSLTKKPTWNNIWKIKRRLRTRFIRYESYEPPVFRARYHSHHQHATCACAVARNWLVVYSSIPYIILDTAAVVPQVLRPFFILPLSRNAIAAGHRKRVIYTRSLLR